MVDEEYKATHGPLTIRFYPLNLKNMRNLESEVAVFLTRAQPGTNPFAVERIAANLALYTASAQQGDPSITREQVELVVNLRNMSTINRVLLGQSIKEEEDAKSAPQTPTSPQNGGESTVV